jgi:small subunit ribosomal protein S16
VVANSESPRDGRYLENVGTYDPKETPSRVVLKTERVQYWLGKGAKPTDTVKSLLMKEGVLGTKR